VTRRLVSALVAALPAMGLGAVAVPSPAQAACPDHQVCTPTRDERFDERTGTWAIGPVDVTKLKYEAAIGSAWLEAVQTLQNLGL
jgi:hypothetical protein